jgi:hypothetical protein
MKLSAEQAQLAYTILQTKGRPTVDSPLTSHASAVSSDLVARVMSRLAETPDPSPDRVAEALDALGGCLPSSTAVAERIIWRAYADSIR